MDDFFVDGRVRYLSAFRRGEFKAFYWLQDSAMTVAMVCERVNELIEAPPRLEAKDVRLALFVQELVGECVSMCWGKRIRLCT